MSNRRDYLKHLGFTTKSVTMNCEHCGSPIPEENIQRVCAYQTEPDICCQDYTGATFCNCCDKCRDECNEAAKTNNNE